jgi:hypothetical protein
MWPTPASDDHGASRLGVPRETRQTCRTGDLYACTDPACGFEILIVRDSRRPLGATSTPGCCCGRPLAVER